MPEQLTVCDVGARWGIAERWSALRPGIRVFGFDPDADECERLNRALAEADDDSVRYIPVALGPHEADVTLHMTREPACSSIYPPSRALAAQFAELACITPVGDTTVRMTTMDQWCSASAVDRIDYMKLDTQGSELGVLVGATTCLEQTLLLEIEVEFNPIYEGQPLFGDVDRFLRERGFMLWRLDHLTHYAGGPWSDGPVLDVAYFDSVPHTRSSPGGQLYWGHAHYAREELCPGTARVPTPAQRERATMLARAVGLTDLADWLDWSDPR